MDRIQSLIKSSEPLIQGVIDRLGKLTPLTLLALLTFYISTEPSSGNSLTDQTHNLSYISQQAAERMAQLRYPIIFGLPSRNLVLSLQKPNQNGTLNGVGDVLFLDGKKDDFDNAVYLTALHLVKSIEDQSVIPGLYPIDGQLIVRDPSVTDPKDLEPKEKLFAFYFGNNCDATVVGTISNLRKFLNHMQNRPLLTNFEARTALIVAMTSNTVLKGHTTRRNTGINANNNLVYGDKYMRNYGFSLPISFIPLSSNMATFEFPEEYVVMASDLKLSNRDSSILGILTVSPKNISTEQFMGGIGISGTNLFVNTENGATFWGSVSGRVEFTNITFRQEFLDKNPILRQNLINLLPQHDPSKLQLRLNYLSTGGTTEHIRLMEQLLKNLINDNNIETRDLNN